MQVSSGISGAQLQDQFLTLLVTQLQNQDPIDPVKQENFISQLAQFTTVEGIEELNVQFSDILYSQQVLNGFNLAGKTISYMLPGEIEPREGTVERVSINDGNLTVDVGDFNIPISQVAGVVA